MASSTSLNHKLPGTGQPNLFKELSGQTGLSMLRMQASTFHGYHSGKTSEQILTQKQLKTFSLKLRDFLTASTISCTAGSIPPETIYLVYLPTSSCLFFSLWSKQYYQKSHKTSSLKLWTLDLELLVLTFRVLPAKLPKEDCQFKMLWLCQK